MSRTVILAVGSVVVGLGVMIVAWRDLRFGVEQRRFPTLYPSEFAGDLGPRWWRIAAEAALPALGAAALMWSAWSAL